MNKNRNFSITVYGLFITLVGLSLYAILTILATKQLDSLQAKYDDKHYNLAMMELESSIKKLEKNTDQLVNNFYDWEELIQQINNPTYYNYWQENRVLNANFIPDYFRKLHLYDRSGYSLLSLDGKRLSRNFEGELSKLLVSSNTGSPVIQRCEILKELYSKNKVIGYFCVDLDLVKGLKGVQIFNYLDIDSLSVISQSTNKFLLRDLTRHVSFSVHSEQALSRMRDVTVETILRFLIVSAVAILFILYIFIVFLGRPLRGLSEHINALKIFGSKISHVPGMRYFNIKELVTVYSALNDYQKHLEESAEELKNSEKYFRSLIENSSDVIISLDGKRMITYASPSVSKILGYDNSEIIGDHIFQLINGDDIELFKHFIDEKTVKKNTISNDGFRFRHKNGNWLVLELAGNIVEDDGISSTLICRDITERKRVQEAISHAHDKALEASRAKSNFLANTSHELRTPLNAILGYTEIIAEDIQNSDFTNVEEDIEKVHTAANSLLHLIDEVLDLSKIESGKMELELEKILVHDLLTEIERTITPLIRKNSNTLEVNISETVNMMHSDKKKLRQIIFNLLSNAAKFTHNGEVSLDVKARKIKGREWLEFIVTDTGVGMRDDQQERVFEPFVQADSSATRVYDGTGLGLTICRSFAHLMFGDISVQSEEGVGSVFTLSLPAKIRDSSERFQPRQAS